MKKVNGQKPLSIRAVVSTIVVNKNYVVAYPIPEERKRHSMKSDDSITFSCATWESSDKPEAGQIVLLTGVRAFKKGWRAKSASPVNA